MNGMRYHCPVCGNRGLEQPAYEKIDNQPTADLKDIPYCKFLGDPSYEVCLCCGYEFGFNDEPGPGLKGETFEEYRDKWIGEGAKYFNSDKPIDKHTLMSQLQSIAVYPKT